MPAYVHVNLRVIDSVKQAALAPRFQAALSEAGGFFISARLLRFLRVNNGLCRWLAFSNLKRLIRRSRSTIQRPTRRSRLNAMRPKRLACLL